MTLKQLVAGTVKFSFYRSGNLYYQCESGFMFPVPITDTNDAAFNAEDKGMLFMRWIRKELEARANESATPSDPAA